MRVRFCGAGIEVSAVSSGLFPFQNKKYLMCLHEVCNRTYVCLVYVARVIWDGLGEAPVPQSAWLLLSGLFGTL